MKFARQEYWSGLSFPSPGDLPDPGIKPRSPALQADSLPSEPQGSPSNEWRSPINPLLCSLPHKNALRSNTRLSKTSQPISQHRWILHNPPHRGFCIEVKGSETSAQPGNISQIWWEWCRQKASPRTNPTVILSFSASSLWQSEGAGKNWKKTTCNSLQKAIWYPIWHQARKRAQGFGVKYPWILVLASHTSLTSVSSTVEWKSHSWEDRCVNSLRGRGYNCLGTCHQQRKWWGVSHHHLTWAEMQRQAGECKKGRDYLWLEAVGVGRLEVG